jgi:NADH dehydrogenase [ubiquinone] 1 alpha subcomplex assembly factor 1
MILVKLFLSYLIFSNMILFNFNKDRDLNNWVVRDDVVMGGRSDGHFEINKEGHAVFYGSVSMENNGGFSSVRYNFDQIKNDDFSKIKIRLNGDGKQYQFRIKSNRQERHSYIYIYIYIILRLQEIGKP